MIEKYVTPGKKLELKAVSRNRLSSEKKDEKVYSSKVFDIISDDQIEILMPIEQTKLILLPVDAEYELFFYTDQGLYQCIGRIIDRYKSNNIYILLVELETNLRKYQRREYYRYSCALEMDSRGLMEQEIEAAMNSKNYLIPGLPLKRSIVVDISGGGLRFISSFKYEKDSIIYCKYKLLIKGNVKEYEIASKVLEVKEMLNRPGEYEHRVQYINVNNEDREEIIQYIFEEERRNRKKERGL